MKTIHETEARQLLENGVFVTCQIGLRSYLTFRNLDDLAVHKGYFKHRVYPIFVLFDDRNYTPLAENAMLVTFDEAQELILSKTSIFYQQSDGIEIEITSLNDLIRLERTQRVSGGNYILYWYV